MFIRIRFILEHSNKRWIFVCFVGLCWTPIGSHGLFSALWYGCCLFDTFPISNINLILKSTQFPNNYRFSVEIFPTRKKGKNCFDIHLHKVNFYLMQLKFWKCYYCISMNNQCKLSVFPDIIQCKQSNRINKLVIDTRMEISLIRQHFHWRQGVRGYSSIKSHLLKTFVYFIFDRARLKILSNVNNTWWIYTQPFFAMLQSLWYGTVYGYFWLNKYSVYSWLHIVELSFSVNNNCKLMK